jgi:hypothetical protein
VNQHAARAGGALGATALPLAIAIAMVVAVHTCFVISASLGHIQWCNPYIDGCATISRASRQEPAVYIYRVLIGGSGLLMIPYWRVTGTWHALLAPSQPGTALVRAFVALGIVGAVALVLNASVLGATAQEVRIYRRVFVIVFFVATYLAAVLSSLSLSRCAAGTPGLRNVVRAKIALAALMLALGVFNYAVLPYFEDLQPLEDRLENAIEWQWVAILCAFFAVSSIGWRRTRLQAHWTASA